MEKRLCRFIIFIGLVGLSLGNSYGQSVEELQSQRKQTLARIATTNKLIKETSKSQSASLQKLNLIKAKIDSRSELIENLEKQVSLYGRRIAMKEKEILVLEKEQRALKQQYAEFIRRAQFSSKRDQVVLYLLASKSISQLYRRLRFYREYVDYQREQHREISRRDSVLKEETAALREDRRKLVSVQQEESESRSRMEVEKAQYFEELGKLMRQEKQLKRQMEADQRKVDRINLALRRLMEEEAKKGKRTKRDAEFLKLSSTFAEHRGRLPWPISNGAISRGFGQEKSKVFKHVKTVSQGVDIVGPKGAKVMAVFPGVVSKIAHIPGGNEVVIIRHGDFLTLYSNLEGVRVQVGKAVRQGEEIARAFREKGKEQSTLHFEVWKGFSAQNPKQWLSR